MKALIAMSGGVDSSVAAHLMKEEGYECVGCTMKLHGAGELQLSEENRCSSTKDIEDARKVAEKLSMPFHVVNYQEGFLEHVVEPFVRTYQMGKTPNPCIDCNKHMKFDRLKEQAQALGCEYVVTGHYARIEEEDGTYVLKKGLDAKKDQSYVLYNLTQEILGYVKFPLGGIEKSEIREMARDLDFEIADKGDSQDICFIPDGDYASFIERFSGKAFEEGDFVDVNGKYLGRHHGIIRYTIGQHKHLGVELDRKMYVVRIDAKNNQVVLGDHEDLFTTDFDVEDFNWISGKVPEGTVRCRVRTRYKQQEQWASVTATGERSIHVSYDEPQRAITPGQSAVLYDEDTVLGGGKII